MRHVRAMHRALALVAVLAACSADPAPSSPPVGRARPLAAPRAADLGVVTLAADESGLPRLVRASAAATMPGSPEVAARAHVERLAPVWGLAPSALPRLDAVGTVPARGGAVVRLRQVLDGIEVDAGELRVLIGAGGALRAVGGTPVDAATPRAKARFAIDEADAIARAAAGLTVERARAWKVWRRDGDRLVAAWRVDAFAAAAPGTTSQAFRAWIAADDGRVLGRRDLTADDAFGYRVWASTTGDLRPLDGPVVDPTPHPTGTPDGSAPAFVAPALVPVESLNAPMDPWLAPDATETRGNNADVYADFNAPDGLTDGDFRATTTAPDTFDRTYDLGIEPLASQDQQMAAIAQLFYSVNWLHDFWYDAGFTEAAGNAQLSNLGRGGVEGDPLLIEAQDAALEGARNNANMSTPGDGLSPRMQVYLWSGTETRALTLTPSNRTPETNSASFGPTDFDLTAAVALGVDDAGASTTDACEAVTADVGGRIGLVDRGNCTFETKADNLMAAGAVGMIVANHTAGDPPPFLGNDANRTATLPSLSVTFEEGGTIKTELGAGEVTAHMQRATGVETDGGLDGTLVAHEFGHYLHHRLSDCGTTMCRALSEGWGDFTGLMLAADADDDLDGTYALAVHAARGITGDAAYFGIRRAPYSVDFARNALTFRHMADGEPPPEGHPFETLGLPNSEVHCAGEIWAEMLWEAYVALQKAGTDFADARARMAQYVVAGLLLAPTDANLTETRDAILAAAAASSQADHDVLAAAFARRGAGTCAVPPPRMSTDFVGIVESYEVAGRADLGSPTLAESATACDADGILDLGETARVTVPVTNGGVGALTGVSVALTTTTPGLTVTPIETTFASLAPGASVDATFDVALTAADGPVDGALTIAIDATGGCTVVDQVTIRLPLNVSDAPMSSTTDTFDAAASVWTAEGDGATDLWTHTSVTALDRVWHADDAGTITDSALVSPPLTASATAPVTLSFQHRHSFEQSNGTLWDGGVIEVSTDGATWSDIATLADPGYTGTLEAQSNNPLGGRLAYGGESAGYPDFAAVSLDLGTALAGQTFRIRFRVATDQSVGAPGWDLDDVALTGIEGTPFPSQVPDTGCDGEPDAGPGPDAGDPGADGGDGGCCRTSSGDGRSAALLALLALAALLRRR